MRFVHICLAAVLPLIALSGMSRGLYFIEHGVQNSSYNLNHGRTIFVARCSRCHSIGGGSAAIGPNLTEIGGNAGLRKPDLSAAEYILESIVNPGAFKAPGSFGQMPINLVNSYNDHEIRCLVAYLTSLGGTPNDEEISQLRIERPEVQTQQVMFDSKQLLLGEELYRGKAGCVSCHPYYGGPENELTAPYLFFRGYRDEQELRRALITPHATVAPQYQQTTVMLSSGKTLTGLLTHRNNSGVTLLVRKGTFQQSLSIPISEIEADDTGQPIIEKSSVSAMPTGIDQLLNKKELDALIAFLIAAN